VGLSTGHRSVSIFLSPVNLPPCFGSQTSCLFFLLLAPGCDRSRRAERIARFVYRSISLWPKRTGSGADFSYWFCAPACSRRERFFCASGRVSVPHRYRPRDFSWYRCLLLRFFRHRTEECRPISPAPGLTDFKKPAIFFKIIEI
jgi:hypothetical protein